MSSHIKYRTCHSHVNCHFVSCIGRYGCTSKCQEVGMQYHQRERIHTMSSISKLMLFTKECRTCLTGSREVNQRLMLHLPDHGIHCSITNCKASQASPYLHVKLPAFYIGLSQSRYLTGMEASVHTTSTAEYVTMQHRVQLGSLHLIDI